MTRKIGPLLQFEQAMNYYREQRFENAVQSFRAILTDDPEDRTINVFMEKALNYMKNGAPENWTGAEEMLSK